MNSEDFSKIKNELQKLPLWRLIILASKCEKIVIEKKKSGMKRTSSLKKSTNIRSVYRNVLLEKLNKWKNGEAEEMGFSDVQGYDGVEDELNSGLENEM